MNGQEGGKWEADLTHDERVQNGNIIDVAVHGCVKSRLGALSITEQR